MEQIFFWFSLSLKQCRTVDAFYDYLTPRMSFFFRFVILVRFSFASALRFIIIVCIFWFYFSFNFCFCCVFFFGDINADVVIWKQWTKTWIILFLQIFSLFCEILLDASHTGKPTALTTQFQYASYNFWFYCMCPLLSLKSRDWETSHRCILYMW